MMWEGLKIGDVLAHRYRICECIGEGGMGRVFLAKDLKLADKKWAVKEIRTDQVHGDLATVEMRMLLKLDHPRLPKIVDYYRFEDSGVTYLVMEYVHGQTLGQLVQEKGQMETGEVIRLALQLCKILGYLHSFHPQPIIHRDLKPDNVIVDAQSEVYLIDFGISRTVKTEHLHDTVRLGSPGFLAPEQLLGKQSDERTDLYQLGLLVIYMLSGGKWTAQEARDGRWNQLLNISDELNSLLEALLNEKPGERPQTAEEVYERLLVIEQKYRNRDRDPAVSDVQIESGSAAHLNTIVEDADGPGLHLMQLEPGGKGLGYIIAGSVYEGAGGSRTALALGKAITDSGLTAAIVEYAHKPELAYRLGADRQEMMVFTLTGSHTTMEPSVRQEPTSLVWRSGKLICCPQRPDTNALQFSPESWYQTLLGIRADIVILDVGCHWRDEFVSVMMERAEHVLCVIDSQMHKWYRKDVESTLERLGLLRAARRNVYTIAFDYNGRKSVWRAFPWPIDLILPPGDDELALTQRLVPLLKRWGIKAACSGVRRGWSGWLRSSTRNV